MGQGMPFRFEDDYAVSLLSDMVNIPSTFPDEREVMLFLEGELQRLGLTVRRIPISETRFNLLARVGGGGRVVCLNAHSDTVPPSGRSVPKAQISDGRLYGLGAADDKSSVAAMVAAVKAVAESGVSFPGTLDLLISVDEEGDGRGVRGAIDQGYRCDMAIVGEPTNLEIVPAHCGIVFLDMVMSGKSTHGSLPMEGVNAIDQMYGFVVGLRELVTDYPVHHLVGAPTMNLGIMTGGDRPNRVPDRCEASVDIRVVPPVKLEVVYKQIDDYFSKWQGKAEYTIAKYGGPLNTPADSPLVKALSKSCKDALGASGISGWRGWTEAESFQSMLGIDAVVFGPGDLKQAHSADEFVELDQVRRAAEAYAQAVLECIHS